MKKLNCIMLIEDDPTTNFYNEFLFNELSVADEVVIRENGEEALDYLEKCAPPEDKTKPSLIFLDINMPVMNGFEFLESFEKRKLNSMDNVMIVMLTTSLHPDDLERAKSFNSVAEYIFKPLTEEKIKALISTHFPD